MSLNVLFSTDETGTLQDKFLVEDMSNVLDPDFGFVDIFIYSHGWWTNEQRAAETYNRFSIEFSRSLRRSAPAEESIPRTLASQSLGIGIHWPATLSENVQSLSNYLEALTYFRMGPRANAVGENGVYVLLSAIVAARSQTAVPTRLHLLGHSFGCKVVCNALQKLAVKGGATEITPNISINIVLLQAAFDHDELDPTPVSSSSDYKDVINSFPSARFLITRSDADKALRVQYVAASKIANLAHLVRNQAPKEALGFVGPSDATETSLDGAGPFAEIDVDSGFTIGTVPSLKNRRLVVANLTKLHGGGIIEELIHTPTDRSFLKSLNPTSDRPNPFEIDFAGHHSDIFREEIYQLIAAFLYK